MDTPVLCVAVQLYGNNTSYTSPVIPVIIPVIIPVSLAVDVHACESMPLAARTIGSPPRAAVVDDSSPLAAVICVGPYSSHCLETKTKPLGPIPPCLV